MIGYVSQLTHAIAVSLMNANDNTHLAEYTGDSFRDLTRIAKINENLWSELFFLNKEKPDRGDRPVFRQPGGAETCACGK